MNGIAKMRASKRSRKPPWPGNNVPESLTFKVLFIMDSIRSPKLPDITVTMHKPIHFGIENRPKYVYNR